MPTMGQMKPFGLRDVKVLSSDGATEADLDAAQVLTVTPTYTSDQLRGDDAVKSVVSFFDAATWNLTQGGLTAAAVAIMTGRTATTAGTTPAQTTTITASAGDVMPYFQIYGKSIGDDTDDVHVLVYKCKITGGGEINMQDGSFSTNGLSGVAIDDGTNGVFDTIHNETATDLP